MISATATPLATPIHDTFVKENAPVVLPTEEAAIFEETFKMSVLEDVAIPNVQKSMPISDSVIPNADPVSRTFAKKNEKVAPSTEKAAIFEDMAKTVIVQDAVAQTVISDSTVEVPVARNIFDVAENTLHLSSVTTNDTSLDSLGYIEVVSVTESQAQNEIKTVPVTKTVKTEFIGDDSKVIEVTEKHFDLAEKASAKIDTVPAKRANIPTIPTAANGEVKHEDPMIPTLPPVGAKGVGSNAAATPFVLPATPEAQAKMTKNSDLMPKDDEDEMTATKGDNREIPVAPIAEREQNKPAPAPKSNDNVYVANRDFTINFGDVGDVDEADIPDIQPEMVGAPAEEPKEEPIVFTIEPEVAEPKVEEPQVEEPATEPVVEEPVLEAEVEEAVLPEEIEEPVVEEPVTEPVVEEPTVAEPIEEPVFTDAEHADELMTDEEAEEHIEMIDETPGEERKGKMHAINLDTLCDSFEDGEKVTLDALKKKKLAPQNAGRVKILARGTMTKSLEVVADNFSLQAVKMITLAGGRAEQYK